VPHFASPFVLVFSWIVCLLSLRRIYLFVLFATAVVIIFFGGGGELPRNTSGMESLAGFDGPLAV
jgi:hypothetical protein